MQCFTVAGIEVSDNITVVEDSPFFHTKGIGLDGTLAVIANGQFFPAPDYVAAINEKRVYIQPGTERPQLVIKKAEAFQFETPLSRYFTVIHREQKIDSRDALVLWIVEDKGLYNFIKINVDGDYTVYEDTVGRVQGYWQFLVRLSPGSAIIAESNYLTLTISWNGKDLNVTKTSQ